MQTKTCAQQRNLLETVSVIQNMIPRLAVQHDSSFRLCSHTSHVTTPRDVMLLSMIMVPHLLVRQTSDEIRPSRCRPKPVHRGTTHTLTPCFSKNFTMQAGTCSSERIIICTERNPKNTKSFIQTSYLCDPCYCACCYACYCRVAQHLRGGIKQD
jgi:hypothetical protein